MCRKLAQRIALENIAGNFWQRPRLWTAINNQSPQFFRVKANQPRRQERFRCDVVYHDRNTEESRFPSNASREHWRESKDLLELLWLKKLILDYLAWSEALGQICALNTTSLVARISILQDILQGFKSAILIRILASRILRLSFIYDTTQRLVLISYYIYLDDIPFPMK